MACCLETGGESPSERDPVVPSGGVKRHFGRFSAVKSFTAALDGYFLRDHD
jgi:hypothetical protein